MTGRRKLLWAAAVGVLGAALLVCPSAAARTDEAKELIDSIVRNAKDSADAAARLVAAARSLEDSPKMQAALCEKAYDYGAMTVAGYDAAIQALDILDRADRSRRDVWRQERLKIYRLRYARSTAENRQAHGQAFVNLIAEVADGHMTAGRFQEAQNLLRQGVAVANRLRLPVRRSLSDKLLSASRQLSVQKRAEALKAKVAADPKAVDVRNALVRLLMADLNSPKEAVKFLTDDCEETLRKRVPLAAGPVEELSEQQALELGQWYVALAGDVPARWAEAGLLTRARGSLERYLELHSKKDPARLKGELLLQDVNKRLGKLGGETADVPAGAIQSLSFEPDHWITKGAVVEIKDVSGRKANAAARGATPVEGLVGRAARLGPGGFIDTRLPHGDQARTFTFWARALSARQAPVMLFGLSDKKANDWHNRFYVGFDGQGRLGLGLGDSAWGDEPGGQRLDTQWHHYALTWDGKGLQLYVDGVVRAAKRGTAGPKGTYYLGSCNFGGASQYPLTGFVDEAIIFGRVLTPAEIQAMVVKVRKRAPAARPPAVPPAAPRPATTRPAKRVPRR